MQEERNKKRKEEIKKIEQIYNSFDPSQQEEIRIETENRLSELWKEKLNRGRKMCKNCYVLKANLETFLEDENYENG